ncbi:DUF6046 domain-containing protein [Candidatus Ornithobacterium hominis]|uniref:DUF6046 domain-containing protein n=1 Tax=Candidatus Ornithobacterium hominis TaxID=2497989 RepID=UPI0024BCA699|nr:DUF6046 domain-containing protein [Candidatus Ornithobacterium hominis]CAI9429699.1 DUF6046 domain-containing protein [Candidatus Ornithobacterium hominis]
MSNSIVINLAERYAAAFGHVAGSKMLNAVVTQEGKDYGIELYGDYDESFEDVVLSPPGMQEFKFSKMLEGDFKNVFAPPLMIDFNREKQLIETEVSGSDNIVVERWGTRPWQLNMRGILIDVQNRRYPEELITKLHRLFEVNNVIPVSGVQLEDKEIDTIYLNSIDINHVEGFMDTIQFSFSASSIKEVDWYLNKPK